MKLLFVDCCISQRGRASRTRMLAEAYLRAFRESHSGWEVEVIDLSTLHLQPLNATALDYRDRLARQGRFDDSMYELARRFRDADRVLVAAPFWDLTFPAILRTYIEYISANGVTYHYDEQGPHGDCHADRLTYLTSGGDFERENSLGVLYWQQMTVMMGIPGYDYVFAGGLDAVPDQAEQIMADACRRAAELAAQ